MPPSYCSRSQDARVAATVELLLADQVAIGPQRGRLIVTRFALALESSYIDLSAVAPRERSAAL